MEAEVFSPRWRHATRAMTAWLVLAAAFLGHEMIEQHRINSDVSAVQRPADETACGRARERLASRGEEAVLYLLQELAIPESQQSSMRATVALEKVARGRAGMVGILQRWALEDALAGARSGGGSPGAEALAKLLERALEAVRRSGGDGDKVTPFELSAEESEALAACARAKRLELWAARQGLAETIASAVEKMAESGRVPGRLVLHDLTSLLGDESHAVRENVARALGAADSAAEPWLMKAVERKHVQPLLVVATSDYTKAENEARLGAENDRRRTEAVRVLGRMNSERARMLLERFVKDPVVGEEAVKILAASAPGG